MMLGCWWNVKHHLRDCQAWAAPFAPAGLGSFHFRPMEATLSHIKPQAASQASWSFTGVWNMEAPHCQRMSAAWHLSRSRGPPEVRRNPRPNDASWLRSAPCGWRFTVLVVPLKKPQWLKGFSQILATKSAPNLEISGDMMRHGGCSHMFTLFLSTRKQKASKPSYLPTRHQISCHPRIRLPSCSRSNAPFVNQKYCNDTQNLQQDWQNTMHTA